LTIVTQSTVFVTTQADTRHRKNLGFRRRTPLRLNGTEKGSGLKLTANELAFITASSQSIFVGSQ
ncbi:hypothetical protein KKI95_19945, partial [Xenorhabdus bovienii]|uniref:hypothetical protein n=1 Tax=Xenorhabdus bovienii TaxID=40576 RepID=UPI0023B2A897